LTWHYQAGTKTTFNKDNKDNLLRIIKKHPPTYVDGFIKKLPG
jgi:hypothetical protein